MPCCCEIFAGVQHGVVLDRCWQSRACRGLVEAATAPKIARLSASVPPLVKTISLGFAPISAATESRAASTAARARWPGVCTELALPKLSRRNGSMASSTAGSTGVVAL